MLFLALTFGFSGYLLPWNELAFFATKVGTDSARQVPLIGDFLLKLMRGGSDVTGATLSRMFGLHVSVLPPIFTMLLGLHLFFVQVQGMSEPMEGSHSGAKKRTMPFLPDFMLRDMVIWLVVLDIIILLSVFFPWELGVKADPFSPAPAGIKPEWYFLPVYQLLKYFPKLTGIFISSVIPLVLIFWPFFDKSKNRHPFKRPISMAIGMIVLAAFLVLGMMAYVSETTRGIFGKTYHFDIYGVPHAISADAPMVVK